MALQQFDLKKIQRLYIRQTKADRTIERRIPFQKPGLTGNGEQPIMGLLPSFPDASEDRLRGFLILHQIRIARSQGHVRFRQHHFHIAKHGRSEEHTSELQSLMRISYAVFCLKKKKSKKSLM